MKVSTKGVLLRSISTTVLCLSAFNAALAQDQTTSTASSDSFLDEIVVTGSTSGRTALETSYGVAAINAEDIFKDNPVGLTDLVDSIPGLQGEFANGEVNSNLNVRGTQAGFMAFISLQEDGLPVQYSPFFSEYELRYDLSYDRVEAVLGGPSGIFTAQGAAATINYISRMPTEETYKARFSVTDYGQYRGDLFVGGPIGDNGWFASLGGHYRRGDGIRDLGFTAANGGQIRANVKKEFENGSMTLAYKRIDDRTEYYAGLPVDVTGKHPRTLEGFDARDDTLVGPDLRYIDAKRPGGIARRDLADGQRSKTDQITLSFDYDIADNWSVTNKARYNKIRTNSHDLRGGANASLREAEDYVAEQLPVLAAAFPTTDSVRLVRVNDGQVITDPSALNGNGLLTISDTIDYTRRFEHFIDDLQVKYEGDRLNATFGLQYWDITSKSGDLQDQFLHDIQDNAMRYDVEALDAAGNVVGHLTDAGVITYGSLDNYGGLDTESINPYVNLEFDVTDRLRIDGGLRYESSDISGFAEDVSFVQPLPDSLNNPLVLADNSRLITRNGTILTGKTDFDEISWTVGGNYTLRDNLAVYGRYASAHDMGFLNEFSFFSIPAFGAPAGSNLGLTDDPTRLKFGELGMRYLGDMVSGYVTAFHTKHKDSGVIMVTDNSANVIIPVDTKAYGAEFEFDVRPIDNVNLNISGVIMDSERKGDGFSGKPLARLPETQLRFAPTWYLGNAELFATVQYYSKRYADQAITRKLPSYTSFDAGVSYLLKDNIRLTLQGNNLTDELAFTAGNFREPLVQGNNPYGYAQAIAGRNFRFSVDVDF